MKCRKCSYENSKTSVKCKKCGTKLYQSKIRIVHEDGTDKTHYLSKKNYTIGRGLDNDIVIDDHSVSRYHAELKFEKNTFLIHDKKSKNGSLLNDAPFALNKLNNNDYIQLGNVTIHFFEETRIQVPEQVDTIEFVQNEYFKLADKDSQTEITTEDALKTILDLSLSLVHADKALVFVYDKSKELKLKLARNITLRGRTIVTMLQAERKLFQKANLTRHLIIDYESGTRNSRETASKRNPRVWRKIIVPMLSTGGKEPDAEPLGVDGVIGYCLILHNKGYRVLSLEKKNLLNVLMQRISLAIENEILHTETYRHKRLNHQISLAKDIQNKLLPTQSSKIQNFNVVSFVEACETISGDYFDLIPISETQMAIAIGDICGKGVPAALLSSTAQASIRAQVKYSTSPNQITENLNRLLIQSTDKSIFLTLFFGIVDIETNKLSFINAGHPPPILIPQKGKMSELLGTAPPLGIMEDHVFDENTTDFNKGDVLIMYTDGFIESHNSEKQIYGRQRFTELVQSLFPPKKANRVSISSVLDLIKKDIINFTNDAKQTDDLTLLAVEREH